MRAVGNLVVKACARHAGGPGSMPHIGTICDNVYTAVILLKALNQMIDGFATVD